MLPRDLPKVPDGFEWVGFDLDGVLAHGTWPEHSIGEPNPDAVELLLHYFNEGYAIIVWTARPQSHAADIWAWLKGHGLKKAVYDVVCGKPLVGLFFDDRAVRWPLRIPYAEWVARACDGAIP